MDISNTNPPPSCEPIPAWVEQRLTELEIKVSYGDDLLEQLNALVYRQQQQIDALVRELRELHQRLPDSAVPGSRNLRDEIPPHY